MTKRIRVLQFITTTIGGAGEHVLMLATGLDSARYDVTVSFSPGCPLDEAFYQAGLRVVPIEMRRSGGALASVNAYRVLKRLLEVEHFDIVHTHTSVAGVIGRLAAKRARVPVVIHMVHAYACHPHVSQPKQWVYRQIERWLDRFTDHYVAGSDYIRNYGIAQGIMSPAKITRIYYALRREHILGHFDRDEYRATLEIPPDAAVVGAIARLEPQKGLIHFIRAMPQILAHFPHTHFVISGDGPLRESLHTEADRLGIASRVHFIGWENRVGKVLTALDVMVLPSLWEAFGIVNVEAMALGVPVIASRVGGVPEVVPDGKAGLLVPPGDSCRLAQAIIELLVDHDKRHALGLNGMKWMSDHFSASDMVDGHRVLYNQLLENLLAGMR